MRMCVLRLPASGITGTVAGFQRLIATRNPKADWCFPDPLRERRCRLPRDGPLTPMGEPKSPPVRDGIGRLTFDHEHVHRRPPRKEHREMCAICGVADASHDELIVRSILLVSGSGALMLPRMWFARARNFILRTFKGA